MQQRLIFLKIWSFHQSQIGCVNIPHRQYRSGNHVCSPKNIIELIEQCVLANEKKTFSTVLLVVEGPIQLVVGKMITELTNIEHAKKGCIWVFFDKYDEDTLELEMNSFLSKFPCRTIFIESNLALKCMSTQVTEQSSTEKLVNKSHMHLCRRVEISSFQLSLSGNGLCNQEAEKYLVHMIKQCRPCKGSVQRQASRKASIRSTSSANRNFNNVLAVASFYLDNLFLFYAKDCSALFFAAHAV